MDSQVSQIMGDITSMLAVIGFFAGVVLSLYFYFKARNRERLALIEKGMDATLLFPKKQPRTPMKSTSLMLKVGLFLIGLGIGVFAGFFVTISIPHSGPVGFFSMVLIFGGLGLIAGHLVSKKSTNNNPELNG